MASPNDGYQGYYGFSGNGVASGTFTNCTTTYGFAFGSHLLGTASPGVFTECIAGNRSFGTNASGTYNRCTAGSTSFGGHTAQSATGTFTDCVGGDTSFGKDSASGVFTRCTGGVNSFGKLGTFTGKIYNCRLTSGTFQTPTGTGTIVLGIDGNNDIVNI